MLLVLNESFKFFFKYFMVLRDIEEEIFDMVRIVKILRKDIFDFKGF